LPDPIPFPIRAEQRTEVETGTKSRILHLVGGGWSAIPGLVNRRDRERRL
jgi:hypothetical protein